MKVLTIREPWATLIIEGYKKYEFRSWKTNYRGKILIHAGKTLEVKNLNKFKNYNISYSCGEIIGEVELVDCIKVTQEFDNELKKINNKVYGNSNHIGKYAWKLEKVRKYNETIKINGKLGLWSYDI